MKVGTDPSPNLPHRQTSPSPLPVRNGDRLEVLVEERNGTGVVVRPVGGAPGVRFAAKAGDDFVVGGRYTVEVTVRGSTMHLRTIGAVPESRDAASIAHDLGLGSDSHDVIRAFLKTGLPLDPALIGIVSRRVRSSLRLTTPERARLATILLDKGLLDSDGVWERLLDVLSGRGGSRGSHDDTRRDADHHDGSADGHDHEDPAQTPEQLVSPEAVRSALTPSEPAGDPLALFNHVSDRDGHWIVVPLAVPQARGSGIAATLRMRFAPLRSNSGGAATGVSTEIDQAIIDVATDDGSWRFAFPGGAKSRRVVVLDVPLDFTGRAADRRWTPLRDALGRLGLDFDPGLMSKDSNDGFSCVDDLAIIQSVDSEA